MIEYRRIVHYYETDKMNITHHSNYVRWMEEARTYFLDKIGIPFRTMEAAGIMSPVVAVNVEYKSPSTYEDEIAIEISVAKYNGVQIEFAYVIRNLTTGKTAALCSSRHCFVKDGRICSLTHAGTEFDAVLKREIADKQ